jgi:alpha-D-ribose 1-methylphosphonate 5-triphosphate synthase subunit PhnH
LDIDFRTLFNKIPPLPITLAALTLTLADYLTPVWLPAAYKQAADWLVFHSSAPLTEDISQASLVLAAGPSELPPLTNLNQGEERYPDRSATVLLAGVLDDRKNDPGVQNKIIFPISKSLDPKTGQQKNNTTNLPNILAEGPGLEKPAVLTDHGLDSRFLYSWAQNNAAYPLGVDVFLAGARRLAGLPRTVKLSYI